jgi:hypothetical protein
MTNVVESSELGLSYIPEKIKEFVELSELGLYKGSLWVNNPETGPKMLLSRAELGWITTKVWNHHFNRKLPGIELHPGSLFVFHDEDEDDETKDLGMTEVVAQKIVHGEEIKGVRVWLPKVDGETETLIKAIMERSEIDEADEAKIKELDLIVNWLSYNFTMDINSRNIQLPTYSVPSEEES